MDSFESVMVCRVCLVMNVNLYNITNHNLNIIYEQVTGIKIKEDKLPQELCSECITRLSSSYKFITKALKTQGLLTDKIIGSGYITLEDIKSINKEHTELIPTNECNINMTKEVNTDSIKWHEDKECKSKEDLKIEYEPIPDIEKLAKENEIYGGFKIKCEPEDNELRIEEVADNSYVFTYTETDVESNILADTIQSISEQTLPQSSNKIIKNRKRYEGKEPFRCGVCEYTTFHRYLLRLHINSKHTKIGVLNCSYCSYTTYYKSHLTLHENAKHTKDKVYACQYCAFESFRKQYLTAHINAIHTKVTSFSCTHCSYTTYYKRLLNKHMKVKHS